MIGRGQHHTNQRASGLVRQERGQAMAETALTIPLLLLLMAGMILAGIVVYRTAASGWGVFIYGTGAGAFAGPVEATGSVPWSDLRGGLNAGQTGRAVRTQINASRSKSWINGIELYERQSGSAFTRRWRFYAGRPEGPWD